MATAPADVFENDNLSLSDPVREPPKAKRAKAEATEKRTTIVLEDNLEIPPTGQFFGLNGVGYILRSGEPASVPDGLLSVLDSAVSAVPITDGAKTVIGYRDRLRFPYRILSDTRKA